MSWEDPMSYPAINGVSYFVNNVFANFAAPCGNRMRDYIWMTTPVYGDVIHPTDFMETTFVDVDVDSKVGGRELFTNILFTVLSIYVHRGRLECFSNFLLFPL